MTTIFASLILNDTKQTEELVKTLSGIEAICHKMITKSDNMLNITLKAKTNYWMSVLLQFNLSQKPQHKVNSAKKAKNSHFMNKKL